MQAFADITKRNIITARRPKTAGALGAAMCVFVGSGMYDDFSPVRSMTGMRREFVPGPEIFDVYDKLFIDYKNIYTSLKKACQDANSARFTF